jgi:hypothetical protein
MFVMSNFDRLSGRFMACIEKSYCRVDLFYV